MTVKNAPRIGLVHALEESVAPARRAFAELWPEAQIFDLLDTSLAPDLAAAGLLTGAMTERFRTLGRYAAGLDRAEDRADGLLFTCSAFGPAIEAVKRDLPIPVFRPNEAAFDRAIATARRIGLIVTFAPSLGALSSELYQMAEIARRDIAIVGVIAEGALNALKAGDGDRHDELIDAAARGLPSVDLLLLGQFSAARAAPLLRQWANCPVLTTPECAVEALRAATAPEHVGAVRA
jgi:Asp/Glu/hydantoin racemase